MDPRIADAVVLVAFIVTLVLYLRRFYRTSSLSLPPGPRRLPLVGNLLQLPTSYEWKTYHKWCKELGGSV